MQIEFLGTGGYHPNERRHTACFMLPAEGIMFDAGTAAFRFADYVKTTEIDLFLSHAHLDHIVGLTYLLPAIMNEQVEKLRVWGTEKTLAAVDTHLLAEPLFPVHPGFECKVLTEQISLANSGKLTTIPLEHPGGSTGFRIDWPDRSMAYVTDTTVDGSYHDFVAGVDLLIHECYFPDHRVDWAKKTGHSHTTIVAQLAKDAGVKNLVLVHLDPQMANDSEIEIDVARAIFPDTYIAEDKTSFTF